MDIAQVVSIGIIGAMLTVMLKKYSPEISMVTALSTGVLIMIIIVGEIIPVINIMKKLAGITGMDNDYIEIVLKVVAIAYISEFGVEICNDSGVSMIASKIELAGKVLILTVAAPVFLDFLERIIILV